MKSCSSFPVLIFTNWDLIPGGFFCQFLTAIALGTRETDSETSDFSRSLGNSDFRISPKLCASPRIKAAVATRACPMSGIDQPSKSEYCSRPRMGIAVGPIFTFPSIVKVK